MTPALRKQETLPFNPLPIKKWYDALADWIDAAPWYRDERVHSAILNLLPGFGNDAILELCCGSGALLSFLARKLPNSRFTAIDISTRMVDLARRNTSAYRNVQVLQGNWIEPLRLMGSPRFDTVVIKNSLHLIPDLEVMLQQLHDIVSSRGKLIVIETVSPNQRSNQFIRNLFKLIDQDELKQHFFSQRTLQSALERAGWFLHRTHGQSNSLLLRQHIDISDWLRHRAKSDGVRGAVNELLKSCSEDVRRAMEFDAPIGSVPRRMLRLQFMARLDASPPRAREAKVDDRAHSFIDALLQA